MGDSVGVPQKTKHRITMWSSSAGYTCKGMKARTQQILIHQCSKQRKSQHPQGGNNPNVHQKMKG